MSRKENRVDTVVSEVDALAQEAVAEIVGSRGAGEEASAAPACAEPCGSTRGAGGVVRAGGTGEDVTRILHLKVPVIVQLAQRMMPLSEIVNLSTGAIIEFDKPADGDLELMINNKWVAKGRAVKAGENFGLRITEIGSVRDRIQALGRPSGPASPGATRGD